MDFTEKKLEYLKEFNELEKKENQIKEQSQQLQAMYNQITQRKNTLNIRLEFITEMEEENVRVVSEGNTK